MKIKARAKSATGSRNSKNEDAYYMNIENGIYVICDGIGSEASGEVASTLCINHLNKQINENRAFIEKARNGDIPDGEIFNCISDLIRKTSKHIYDISTVNEQCFGMGTTLTLLIVLNNRFLLCHVGDSKAYLISEDDIHQLTVDHVFTKANC